MLYTHATIITVDSSRRIINDGAILVTGDTIADIGKTALLQERYPKEDNYDLSGRIVIPGLISTHMHTAQTLLRGTADDLELVSWLCERIWVLQGNFTEADGYAAARLSIGEMLKSGTTCFLESMVNIESGSKFRARADPRSLQIAMASMDWLVPLKNLESEVAWERLSWTLPSTPKTTRGRCIPVSWRIARHRCWERSKCGKSGTAPRMTAFASGSGLARLEGKC